MSVLDENLAKYTLLVQRCPQAFIDYHTMLFPPLTSFIRQSIQEREREREREREDLIMKVQGITKHFYERKAKYL